MYILLGHSVSGPLSGLLRLQADRRALPVGNGLPLSVLLNVPPDYRGALGKADL